MNGSNPSREAALARLKANPVVDVLVIGGGINGAGVFRDLALQGVDCLIVDKADWCAGASAAPSRLIHGGLKYLETGEFRLVAESTRERNRLLRNAPHFVHPLASVVPIRSVFGGLLPAVTRFFGGKASFADRGALIVELGMLLYDILGLRDRTMPFHRFQVGAAVRRAFPNMSRDVSALATYYDARVSQAERLAFELVDDGLRAHPGANAINYLAAEGFAGGVVRLVDQRSHQVHQVRPAIIVNAAGPWIDKVNRALEIGKTYISGAKGSHLILDNAALVAELKGRMVYYGGADGRVSLVYPFFGHALIGSTDIACEDPDKAECEADEIVYMLDALRELFPGVGINASQIIYRYCGVRPLPQAGDSAAGEVTRDHSLERDERFGTPSYAMIGGKWTTFRAFAEETADVVLASLGRKRLRTTEREPVGGGRGFPASKAEREAWIERFSMRHKAARDVAERWLDRYGVTADRIAVCAGAAMSERLVALPSYARGEIEALARLEHVVSLTDLIFRRTPIAISGLLTVEAVLEIGAVVGGALGWTREQIAEETALTLDLAQNKYGVHLSTAADMGAASN